MDKRKITRRRLLGSAAATVALLLLPPWKASSLGPIDGDVPPGLTPDSLDRYLATLRHAKVMQVASSASTARSWTLTARGSSDRASVVCALDDLGSVARVEARATGFSVRALLEGLARIPFDNADTETSGQWVRAACEQGFERWPEQSRFELWRNGVRYEVTGSFNSNGYSAVLSAERSS